MKKLASLVLLAIASGGALAQDSIDTEEPADVRRYTVEMIIFSYAENVSVGSEVFPADEPAAELELPVEPILDPTTVLQSIPESVEVREEQLENELVEEELGKYELLMLAEEDFTLLDTVDRLERLDAYNVLLHFGWTQATYPEEETEARPLSSFVTPPKGLEGDLLLYLSRYLHLAINLQLDEAPLDEAEEAYSRSGGDDQFAYGDDEPVPSPVRYRIEEDRIFRNGELRYYDHPKFGVLAKITRVEEEEPPEDELFDNMEMLGDGELLGDDPE
jgi:hypothetical protein